MIKQCLFVVVLLLGISATAQTKHESFEFNNTEKSAALKTVVETFGFFLSFDPDSFEHERIAKKYQDQTLREILEDLLGQRFTYKIIEEYVIVTKKEQPQPATVKVEHVVVYDTIIVQEKKVLTDTQVVVLQQKVYDTTYVSEHLKVYDTLRVVPQPKKWSYGFGVGGARLVRDQQEGSLRYTGVKPVVFVSRDIGNFEAVVSLSYGAFSQNFAYTEKGVKEAVQIDTVATFYVVENGEQMPVYVVDTTNQQVAYEERRMASNVLQLLTVGFSGGYLRTWKKLSVGLCVGVTADFVLKSNEVVQYGERQLSKDDYVAALWNVKGEIPCEFGLGHIRRFRCAPYVQLGLNDGLKDGSSLSFRRALGVDFSVFF